MPDDLVAVEDSHPRDGLFTQPLVVSALAVGDPEPVDADHVRVSFRATVKDDEGRRCPDIAVDATISGPARTASGMATTDLMGTVTFRMAGPPGTYRVHIDDVAAGGLAWDPGSSHVDVEVDARP